MARGRRSKRAQGPSGYSGGGWTYFYKVPASGKVEHLTGSGRWSRTRRIPVQQVGNDRWKVWAEVVESQGRLVIRSLHIEPRGDLPEQGLTEQDLRRLRLPGARAAAQQAIRSLESKGLPVLSSAARRRLREPTQQGRASDPAFYAGVALQYLDALRVAPNRPIAYMAEQLKRGGTKRATPGTVRSWVHLARKYGWLTEGKRSQGYGGAEPTRKLKAWQKGQRGGRKA